MTKNTENNNTKTEFVKALALFKKNLVQPKKDGVNPHFKSKYVTLDAVVDAVDSALEGTGLIYTQMPQFKDGDFVLLTTIMHENGEWLLGSYVLPATGKPQEIGAALTYARRYALAAAFGVVADEDDDGNTAAVVIKKATPAETEAFKNYKAAIKSIDSREALDAFIAGAAANIARLPEDLKAELRSLISEIKQSLGA